jgi:2-C-methyl-D-erythritol 4-phosphate cytidylyltransferase
MKKYVIIVAGGSGARMKSSVPKQFLLLNGLPVLMYTLKAFYAYDKAIEIILSLPPAEIERWAVLCKSHDFSIAHTIVSGGATRFHSVLNGLNAIEGDGGIVAIHDGVRPLVSSRVIREAYSVAEEKDSAVASVPLKDSIRKVFSDTNSKHQDRTAYMLVQTPQTFKVAILKRAYSNGYQEQFTDDASVFEAAGGQVTLVGGDYSNIKITTPEDLLIAEALMKKEK